MTFKETQKYLNSFINYENKDDYSYKESFRFERIKEFLKIISNPHKDLKFIHIAGSKGKGSTCAFIAYILRAAGFKTGLYTSPHLWDFRERIRILDHRPKTIDQRLMTDFEGLISKEEITNLVEKLRPVIDKFNKNSEFGPLSFFEVYTAIAFEHFKNENVDFAVLETGMGGRLDATNVVSPLVACITPISLEHTQILGNTLKEIAGEKSGIIKNNGQIVVVSQQEKEALQVIEERCLQLKAKLFVFNKDFSFSKVKSNFNSQSFNFSGIFERYDDLKLRLLGRHQIINAATAVACIEALRLNNINILKEVIKKGLAQTRWPGRFELIRNAPLIILDSAHNSASARALRETFKEAMNSAKAILVFGISNDKDIQGVVRELEGLSENIILTKADNPRAAEPEELKKFFSQNKNINVTQNTQEAINLALRKAKEKDTILVTGSLFVVGEVRQLCLN
ncbi:MAG: folylpolyglutamate synthase/dihydrofolate synthase family protein [Candidatus Omnitrophota bacterium]|nr:folylpolyglutamate synthase/dihydrofolate synthase family protein [Candidatus Omnitrophota bacterium]